MRSEVPLQGPHVVVVRLLYLLVLYDPNKDFVFAERVLYGMFQDLLE